MTHQAHPSITNEAVQLLAEHGFDGMARAWNYSSTSA